MECRLIEHNSTDGVWNMAVDETLLKNAENEDSLPVLRLYGWSPDCLSLGLSQPAGDVDLEVLRERRIDLVRRPTGGSAVFHGEELTYSIAAPANHPLVSGGVLESYERLAQGLIAILRSLGLRPVADGAGAGLDRKVREPVCFAVPGRFEITVEGRKVIGSAQARRRLAVLQHGSLPLNPHYEQVVDILRYPDEESREKARQKLRDGSVSLQALVGYPPDWRKVRDAFVDAFAQTFDITFLPSELSGSEKAHAQKLMTEKYGASSWTMRF